MRQYFKKIQNARDTGNIERRPRKDVIVDHHNMSREERLYFSPELIKQFSYIMRDDITPGDRFMVIHEVGRLT